MRRCPTTTKQLYPELRVYPELSVYPDLSVNPELSVRMPSRLKRGEDAEGREVKGSDYLRPFARIQEVIAVVAATEATSTVEYNVARSK